MCLFKRKVDVYHIEEILRNFIDVHNIEDMIIYFEITNSGIVILHTNKPGILIGKAGRDIGFIECQLKNECNVKSIRIREMRNVACSRKYNRLFY